MVYLTFHFMFHTLLMTFMGDQLHDWASIRGIPSQLLGNSLANVRLTILAGLNICFLSYRSLHCNSIISRRRIPWTWFPWSECEHCALLHFLLKHNFCLPRFFYSSTHLQFPILSWLSPWFHNFIYSSFPGVCALLFKHCEIFYVRHKMLQHKNRQQMPGKLLVQN